MYQFFFSDQYILNIPRARPLTPRKRQRSVVHN